MTMESRTDSDSFDIPTEEISFQRSQNYCVCYVDMIDSTRVSLGITEPQKIRSYYTVFLNATAAVAKSFGAKLVKNAGDAIIFYFPETTDATNRAAFRDVLECCATMIASRHIVNIKLRAEGIEHSMNFRISADYGTFEIASSMSSRNEDLFGPTMNICAKINAKAGANSVVIGGDLYRVLKGLSLHNDYKFKEIEGYSADNKHCYPVYNVSKYGPVRNDGVNNLFHNLKSRADGGIPYSIVNMDRSPNNRNARSNAAHEHSRPPNIMLVDDEPDILLVYKSFLSSEGYNVELFTDSQEALAYFAKLNLLYYDLVIMDIRMPNINGFQLYQRLKAINKDVRVLFLSALEIAEEVSTLLPEIKNNDILMKPISKQKLLAVVKSKIP